MTMLARFEVPGFRNRAKGADAPQATHQGEAAGTKSRLSISRVTKDDRDAVMALARRGHEESIFGDLPFSEKKFKALFDRGIKRPKTHLGLKATIDGRIIGFAYCYLGEYYVATGGLIATINVLYVDKEVRESLLGGKAALKLLRGIMKWARASKVFCLMIHVTSGLNIEILGRFFKKMKYNQTGGNYQYVI